MRIIEPLGFSLVVLVYKTFYTKELEVLFNILENIMWKV